MSRSEDKTYSSLSEVPGTMVERHAVEDERFTAGALYNLASSSTGVTCILDAGDNAVLGKPHVILTIQMGLAHSISGWFCGMHMALPCLEEGMPSTVALPRNLAGVLKWRPGCSC